MKNLGIVLVALGVLALVYGGITYSRNKTVLEMGDISVTATENRDVPIPAILGGLALIGGAVLLVGDSRRVSRG